MINVRKSAYDKAEISDGRRILVMSLWPRGVAKEKVDVWMKELGAPMDLVHEWKAGTVSWEAFSKRYLLSLRGKEPLLGQLAREARRASLTLLCTDRDPARCHRSLLKGAIEELAQSRWGSRSGSQT